MSTGYANFVQFIFQYELEPVCKLGLKPMVPYILDPSNIHLVCKLNACLSEINEADVMIRNDLKVCDIPEHDEDFVTFIQHLKYSRGMIQSFIATIDTLLNKNSDTKKLENFLCRFDEYLAKAGCCSLSDMWNNIKRPSMPDQVGPRNLKSTLTCSPVHARNLG